MSEIKDASRLVMGKIGELLEKGHEKRLRLQKRRASASGVNRAVEMTYKLVDSGKKSLLSVP